MRARRRVPPATLKSAHYPAPIGGINTIDGGTAMPPQDATYLYNLLPAEYGVRSRLGFKEWRTGLTGAADLLVRTVLPFAASNPANDKLFATTSSGIWDVTVQAVFSTAWANATTYSAGDLVSNDGNIYKCRGADGTPAGRSAPASPLWAPSTAYTVDDVVVNAGDVYICTANGTSAASGGPSGTDANIVDGTANWGYVSASTGPSGIGTAIPDGVEGLTWDYVRAAASDAPDIAFPATITDAGWGVSCTMSTPAGRFLLYADEVNGLYIYPEGGAWAKVALGVSQPWAASTTYLVGDQVVSSGNVYRCVTEGFSSSTSGPTGTGTGIVDGTAHWDYVSAAASSVIGPSLADQEAGFGGDPADFVFVTVFKSRVWLVERNSTRAWYLDTNSVYGVATSFDFGPKMRAGGPLRGLFDWSYDGGNGLDTLLVGISGAGDIVIYQGTDPSSASSFGIKGSWFVGGIPAGRRFATNYGGELLVCSLLGIIPLSKLVVGRDPADWKQYETAKITNLFNDLASTRQALDGWALHVHPTDNALLVLVPTADGAPTEQLAMSFGSKGWARYRDLPMVSAGTWNGVLYFGTADGRVCQNTEYVDDVKLDGTGSYTPVQYAGLTAFRALGAGNSKRVQMIRPTLLSQTTSPLLACSAQYDFAMDEPPQPTGNPVQGSNTWDAGKWDSAAWAGEYGATQPLRGAVGVGRNVAVAFVGSATARTVIVGFDLFYDEGWPL